MKGQLTGKLQLIQTQPSYILISLLHYILFLCIGYRTCTEDIRKLCFYVADSTGSFCNGAIRSHLGLPLYTCTRLECHHESIDTHPFSAFHLDEVAATA